MPISLKERLVMMLRKAPVAKISRALAMCEAEGISITAQNFETHNLCGKDPLVLAEALVLAKQLGVETTFLEMSAVLLAGHDARVVLLAASEDRAETWDTFSPTRPDAVRGFLNDGVEVRATISIAYRLSVGQVAFTFSSRAIHERLGAAVSVFINTAASRRDLAVRQSAHEAELKLLALDSQPGVKSVTLSYQ